MREGKRTHAQKHGHQVHKAATHFYDADQGDTRAHCMHTRTRARTLKTDVYLEDYLHNHRLAAGDHP